MMKPEHKEYLDGVRKSGESNMHIAVGWLADEFGLNKDKAREIVDEWRKDNGNWPHNPRVFALVERSERKRSEGGLVMTEDQTHLEIVNNFIDQANTDSLEVGSDMVASALLAASCKFVLFYLFGNSSKIPTKLQQDEFVKLALDRMNTMH